MERGTSVVDSYVIMIYPLTATQATQIPVEDGVVGCIRDDQAVIDYTLSCNGGQSESGYAPNRYAFLVGKTDGRKWRCKNEAKEGYLLSEHHLTQLKSYNNNHTKCPWKSVNANGKASSTSTTDYYNYSGFGPW